MEKQLSPAEDVMSFKAVIVGQSGSGKSALVEKLTSGCFLEEYAGTVGVDFLSKTLYLTDGGRVRMQIWDTAGHARFQSLIPQYIRNSHAGIVTFALTDRQSFVAVSDYVKAIRGHSGDDNPIILVGCKRDLADAGQRQISTEEAQTKADELNLDYFEVSAKEDKQVNTPFRHIATILHDKQQSLAKDDITNAPLLRETSHSPKADGFVDVSLNEDTIVEIDSYYNSKQEQDPDCMAMALHSVKACIKLVTSFWQPEPSGQQHGRSSVL